MLTLAGGRVAGRGADGGDNGRPLAADVLVELGLAGDVDTPDPTAVLGEVSET